ncbi:MAG: hypothetical protein P4M09_23005 [Devosia sp.]|nr:hypothetical protein [Devosia sp.]
MRRLFVPLAWIGTAHATPAATAAPPDIEQALHDAVARCWNPPAKAIGSAAVRFELRRDGSVVGIPVASGLANAGVAKAAVRAVQFCQPYRLPAERFTDWQHASVRLTAGTAH